MSASDDRSSLTPLVESITPHDHLCLIYETRAEQFAAVMPFPRLGLARGEQCVYIADENTAAEVLAALGAEGVDVEGALASGAQGPNRHTPIVMVTATRDHEAIDRGFEAGAVLFLKKPFTATVLRSTVESAIG